MHVNDILEMINIQQINEAYERLLKGDVKYRFVIDMPSALLFYYTITAICCKIYAFGTI